MRWPAFILRPQAADDGAASGRHYAEQVSERVPEATSWKPRPDTVHYSEFWNIGRSTRDAWPHRWIYATDNSASTLSIMALPEMAHFPTIPSAMVQRVGGTPFQLQNPVKESVSIKTPKQGTAGEQRVLSAPIPYGAAYAKLF